MGQILSPLIVVTIVANKELFMAKATGIGDCLLGWDEQCQDGYKCINDDCVYTSNNWRILLSQVLHGRQGEGGLCDWRTWCRKGLECKNNRCVVTKDGLAKTGAKKAVSGAQTVGTGIASGAKSVGKGLSGIAVGVLTT